VFRAVRHRSTVHGTRPTSRGLTLFCVGVACLIGAAAFGRTDLLFVGFFLTIAPLAAMISVTIERPRLTLRRSLNPDAVAVGESATVVLRVRNQSTRPSAPTTWRDSASSGIRVGGRSALPRLAEHRVGIEGGNDTATLTHNVQALARGSHDIGPLIVSRADPFGLADAEFVVGQSRQILVTPRVTALSRGELEIARSEGTEHELLHHSIPSADELIAREYRSGDPLRRVHWRATARHDKLMVRQEEQRSNPEAWVLFDTQQQERPDAHPTADGFDSDFEAAVELLASIGVHLIEEGFDVSVVETGPRQLTGRTGSDRAGGFGLSTPTFDRAGADRALLADLANIVQTPPYQDDSVAELASGLRRSGRAVPVFAILCDGELAQLGALAALRPMAEPAVAFIGERADDRAFDVLGSAGWNCVALAANLGPAAVWQRALAQQRGARQRG
jgi:uncharacterized protein (DUF58 family)